MQAPPALVGDRFFVGILPGAGATIASALTYMTEKKISGNMTPFGSMTSGGATLKWLTTPRPAVRSSDVDAGSGTTAVMMGALTPYNIEFRPGDVHRTAGYRLG